LSFRKSFVCKRLEGMILVTSIILLSVALGTMILALTVVNKTFEGHSIVINSLTRENIAKQSFAITEKWFSDSIKNGEIPLSGNVNCDNVPNIHSVFHTPSHLLEPLFKGNDVNEIKAYVVDANYATQTPEIILSETIFIEPHTLELNNKKYDVRHYFLNVFVKLNQDDKVQLQLNKEVLVLTNELNQNTFINSASERQLIKTNS